MVMVTFILTLTIKPTVKITMASTLSQKVKYNTLHSESVDANLYANTEGEKRTLTAILEVTLVLIQTLTLLLMMGLQPTPNLITQVLIWMLTGASSPLAGV